MDSGSTDVGIILPRLPYSVHGKIHVKNKLSFLLYSKGWGSAVLAAVTGEGEGVGFLPGCCSEPRGSFGHWGVSRVVCTKLALVSLLGSWVRLMGGYLELTEG